MALLGSSLVCALIACLVVSRAAALADSTVTVTTYGYGFFNDGHCSLEEAISVANGTSQPDCPATGTPGGVTTIDVPAGEFVLGGELDLSGAANVVGAGAGARGTKIDAQQHSRVLTVEKGAQVSVSAVELTGGVTPTGGGGVYNLGSLTISESLISGNATLPGSNGLNGSCSGPTCTAGGNGSSSASGGGIYNAAGATLTLRDSSVTDNHTGTGGAGGKGADAEIVHSAYGGAGGNGANSGAGGGIHNLGTLTIARSKIDGNTTGPGGAGGNGGSAFFLAAVAGANGGSAGDAGPGAGVYNGGSLTIGESTIGGNRTGAGGAGGSGGAGGGSTGAGPVGDGGNGAAGGAGGAGAGVADAAGTFTLTASTVSGNLAGDGGAGGNGGAVGYSPGPTNTPVSGAGGEGGDGGAGGGLDGSGGAISATDDTIASNVTGEGGRGGLNGEGECCEVSGADGAGGGIEQGSTEGVSLTSVTVSSNRALGLGGGLDASSGSISESASVVASDESGQGGHECDGTITGGNDIVFGERGTCLGTAADPRLGPLQDNGGPTETMALTAGSAARDVLPAGPACPAADQRGVPRPQGAACDLGAYEVAPPDVSGASANASGPTSATVSATVDPKLQSTAISVRYGTTASYGSTHAGGVVTATGAVAVTLVGLSPGTGYHAELVASNGDGTTTSQDVRFTTMSGGVGAGPSSSGSTSTLAGSGGSSTTAGGVAGSSLGALPNATVIRTHTAGAIARGSSVIVKSGYTVACPATVSSCSVTVSATTSLSTATIARPRTTRNKMILVASSRISLAPGARRAITFRLTSQGARALRRRGRLTLHLRVVVASASFSSLAVVRIISISAPGTRVRAH